MGPSSGQCAQHDEWAWQATTPGPGGRKNAVYRRHVQGSLQGVVTPDPLWVTGLARGNVRARRANQALRIRSVRRSAQRHKGGGRRQGDIRGAECHAGPIPPTRRCGVLFLLIRRCDTLFPQTRRPTPNQPCALLYLAIPSIISVRAESGPSQPRILTHLPTSRSL